MDSEFKVGALVSHPHNGDELRVIVEREAGRMKVATRSGGRPSTWISLVGWTTSRAETVMFQNPERGPKGAWTSLSPIYEGTVVGEIQCWYPGNNGTATCLLVECGGHIVDVMEHRLCKVIRP